MDEVIEEVDVDTDQSEQFEALLPFSWQDHEFARAGQHPRTSSSKIHYGIVLLLDHAVCNQKLNQPNDEDTD